MSEDRKPPRFEEAERSFRELLERAKLPAPDEVLVETETEELLFLWNGPKIAIVLELSEEGEGDQHGGRANELLDRLGFDLVPELELEASPDADLEFELEPGSGDLEFEIGPESDLFDPGCVGTFGSLEEVTFLGDFGGFRVPPERLM